MESVSRTNAIYLQAKAGRYGGTYAHKDYASLNELICLSNIENLNTVFIKQGMPQHERLVKLNQIAIH